MSDLMLFYRQQPPIARTFAAAVLATSVGIYAGIIPFSWVYFQYPDLFKLPPRLWLLLTNFFVTQPKLGILLDTYFTFNYLSQLETSSPKFNRKEDLMWYLVTVGGMIILPTSIFGSLHFVATLVGPHLADEDQILNQWLYGYGLNLMSLILALAYTATQDMRGAKVTYFVVTVPAQLVPYCMLLMTLVVAGWDLMVIQSMGIFAAHMHDFLTRIYPEFGGGPNLLPTPAFLSRLVSNPRAVSREYGTGFRAGGQPTGSSTGSSTGSGPLPDSWKSRGSGQRLGGD